MEIKLFPEIGGEDGIWIDYQDSMPVPVPEFKVEYVPGWSEIWGLIRKRIALDWSNFRKWVRSKWYTISRR